MRKYQSKIWHGCTLKVEEAKESFLEKLKKERIHRSENSDTRLNNTAVDIVKINHNAPKNKKIVFNYDDEYSDFSHISQTTDYCDNYTSHKWLKRKLPHDVEENKNNMDSHGEDEVPQKRKLPMFQDKNNMDSDGEDEVSQKRNLPMFQDENNMDSDGEDEVPRKRNLPMFRGVIAYESDVQELQAGSSPKNVRISDNVETNKSPEKPTQTRTLIKWKNWAAIEENNTPLDGTKIFKQSKFCAENKRKTALEERWNNIKEQKEVIKKAIQVYVSLPY